MGRLRPFLGGLRVAEHPPITADRCPGFRGDKGEATMTVYSGPVFDMAVNQFGVIANHLEIPMDERDRILMPKRADHRFLSDPPRRRHGRGVRRLPGAASPHPRSDQGRHAVCALRRYRRGRGACDLDELEMRAGRAALWRRQGRRQCRSLHDFQARTGGAVAPLHAGNDSVRRPAYRRDGAGHGHQRAGDGLVHGHLFDVSGPHRDRDRHRQAGVVGRHARPARSHRARRRLSRQARAEGTLDQSGHAPPP